MMIEPFTSGALVDVPLFDLPTGRPKRPRGRAHSLLDCDPEIGVVRCQDGDENTFLRLAAELIADEDLLDWREPCGRRPATDSPEWLRFVADCIARPTWRWFRINPSNDDEYSWMLGHPKGPGRGNWRGAYITVLPTPVVPADTAWWPPVTRLAELAGAR